MVRRSFLVLWLLSFLTCLQAETMFQVKLLHDKPLTNIELGKPLWLELTSNRPTPSLDTINFNELSAQFHIDKTLPIKVDPKSGKQSWRIRLYAYTTGTKSIPPLVYGYQRSNPFNIEVTSAIDPKTSAPLQLQTYLSHPAKHAVWLREQILVRYTIITSNAYSQFQVPDYAESKLEVHPFKLAAKPLTSHQFQYSLGWSIHAKQTGQLRLALPPLQFMNDGMPTHHFYQPPLQLEIKPLPIYVPATMPIGQVSLDLPGTWRFNLSNRLDEFQVNITGKGLPISQIPDIASEIASTRTLRIYPARSEIRELFTEDGVVSQASYLVPYKPLAQGLLPLQPIQLNYFDPRTATIRTIQQESIRIIAVNRWLAWLVSLVLLYLIYRALSWSYRLLRNKALQYQCYYHVLQRLPASTTAQDIRYCMALMAQAEKLSENLSVGQWLMQLTPESLRHSRKLQNSLNAFLYQTKSAVNVKELVQALTTICLSRHPLLKFFR